MPVTKDYVGMHQTREKVKVWRFRPHLTVLKTLEKVIELQGI